MKQHNKNVEVINKKINEGKLLIKLKKWYWMKMKILKKT